MALGTESSFVVYPDLFFSGVVEVLQQEADIFNAASNGAIRLLTMSMRGDYEKESFFRNTSGIVNFRNPNGTGTVVDSNLAMGEIVSIKSNRRIGPVADTIDAFKKIALDPVEFSTIYGQQWGVAVAIDYANTALATVSAAIQAVQLSGMPVLYDNTTQTVPTLTHTSLVNGMSLFGDRSSRLVAFVMHSASYFELVKQSIADKIYQVAGVTIYTGTAATFGKPVVVIDSPALQNGSTGSSAAGYNVLALVEDAVMVVESEDRSFVAQLITGLENLGVRLQGEYAFNTKVKNTSFNMTLAGINPTPAALANPANWTFMAQDLKNGPGTIVKTL